MNFSSLFILHSHIQYISSKTGLDGFWAVGGCVRDILLGRTNTPQDIDITGPYHPEHVWDVLDPTDCSLFRTEKFGTVTIVPKHIEESPNISGGLLQYEITPFRTEGGYTDHRRPDEIQWSENLLDDAKRRDFTMNCLYYTFFAKEKQKSRTQEEGGKVEKYSQGFEYIAECGVLVVRDHILIEHIQKNGADTVFDLLSSYDDVPPVVGVIADPYRGIIDMQEGCIRTVGNADARFEEDALRIVRALRFLVTLNADKTVFSFDIHKDTWRSLKKNFYRVVTLPKERLKIEFDKVAKRGSLFAFVSLCDELNLLKTFFPVVYATKHIDQPVRYHPFDVYAHTMLCLYHLEQLSDDYLCKWAILYHDVGKVDQYYAYSLGLPKEEINNIEELNHRNSSSILMKQDLQAMGFSKKELKEISRYIDHHHRPYEITTAKAKNRKKKLRELYSEVGEDMVRNLFVIARADVLGQYNIIQTHKSLSELDEIVAIFEQLVAQEGQFTKKQLVVGGKWLMEQYGINPGPQMGTILDKIFDWVRDDPLVRNTKTMIRGFLKGCI